MKALLFGATGLTGSHLLMELVRHTEIDAVKVFTRKPLAYSHHKIIETKVSFDEEELLEKEVKGDLLLICLGTTLKKAGSVEAFKHVDYDLVIKIARIAQKNHVPVCTVVSSIGANEKSKNYYLRTKGNMETDLINLNIPHTFILRPSLLLGKRKEVRAGEIAGKAFSKLIGFAFFGKWRNYRPIEANKVAKAMLLIALAKPTQTVYESEEIRQIAERAEGKGNS